MMREIPMFLDIDSRPRDSLAAIAEQGGVMTYGDLRRDAALIADDVPPRSLAFILCENSLGSVMGYIAFLSSGTVPLLLDNGINPELLAGLVRIYDPEYIWQPESRAAPESAAPRCALRGYRLWKTRARPAALHKDLALLVCTSGSTGSPKLVRQSYQNIESNTASIVNYLGIDNRSRAITTLPMHYVYGLSIINSHIKAGGVLLLTRSSLIQPGFWNFFKKQSATTLAGVPYTYEILDHLRFYEMELPALRSMTQAGGRLPIDLQARFARYAARRGIEFIIMYGASEATARMGYLPAEMATQKIGSIGIAIPGGEFQLRDGGGRVIKNSNENGELFYLGANVTFGYADNRNDLARGDENKGCLATGDLAYRDEEGFYYISGRIKRFVKIFGNRISLDEMEALLRSSFPGLRCVCVGRDDFLCAFIENFEAAKSNDISDRLRQVTGLHHSALAVMTVDSFPKNEAGKVRYSDLERLLARKMEK